MSPELLSDVCHLATRLQSAGMIHVATMREFRAGDPIEPIRREAEGIAALTEKLAFKVAQLQTSIAAEVRRPRLDEFVTLGRSRDDAVHLHRVGMLADGEGDGYAD